MREHYDALVVGGGFFGAILAGELRRSGLDVVLCEKEGRPPHSDPGTAPWPPPWPRAPKAIS